MRFGLFTATALSAFAVAAPAAGADVFPTRVLQYDESPSLIYIAQYDGKASEATGVGLWFDPQLVCGDATITIRAWVGSNRRSTSGDLGCVGLGSADWAKSPRPWAGVDMQVGGTAHTEGGAGLLASFELSVLRTAAAEKSRKKITKTVRWEITSTGRPVFVWGTDDTAASGRLQLTTQFVPASKKVTRRIWADTNRDSFYNYCLNRGKRTYSSGGRIYCWYWKPGVRSHWKDTAVELEGATLAQRRTISFGTSAN